MAIAMASLSVFMSCAQPKALQMRSYLCAVKRRKFEYGMDPEGLGQNPLSLG